MSDNGRSVDPPNSTGDEEKQVNGSKGGEESQRYRQPFRTWVAEHFEWSWFTCTQSTGGIAAALSECPKQFAGLQTIGVVIFIFNIVLFLIFLGLLITRWTTKPATIWKSFIQPPENYFFGSLWLSMATMIINMELFGVPHSGPWLIVAIRVCFWIYAAITLLSTTLHLTIIMKYTEMKAINFSPPMFLLIFNAMLTGTVAGVIATSQPPVQRLPIMVAGVAFQGLGWIMSLLFLPWFVGSLLENGWGSPHLRPGLFITIGSAGFTIVALIGIARAVPEGYAYFGKHPMAGEVLQIVALWASIFMWLFAFWLFGIAFLINIQELLVKREGKWRPRMHFTNSWWALIFPNVGFTISTVYIGQELESEGIQWVSVVMIILLVTFWLMDSFLMAKSIAISFFVDARIKLA